jgi:hypothetical protein
MRYSDWEQRQLDIASGLELDRAVTMRRPCKNKSPECGPDGECLRCGAIQGEACLPIRFE